MVLPLLEGLVRVEVGVFVVQPNDEAHEHEVRFHVVQKRSCDQVAKRSQNPPFPRNGDAAVLGVVSARAAGRGGAGRRRSSAHQIKISAMAETKRKRISVGYEHEAFALDGEAVAREETTASQHLEHVMECKVRQLCSLCRGAGSTRLALALLQLRCGMLSQ